MPTLDVTTILTDPMLADRFSVIRRAENIDAHGRLAAVETTIPNVIGVVTASSPSDLDRQTDYDSYTRSITVVSKFKLRGQTAGGKPDFIIWRGSRYIVKHVDLYPHFGPGFYQAEASSVEHEDPDIIANNYGTATFNSAAQSSLIGVLTC